MKEDESILTHDQMFRMLCVSDETLVKRGKP